MSLDLEEGDEELAEASPRERRRAARKAVRETTSKPASKSASSSRSRASASDRVEAELLSRLDRTCLRIADMLTARGDDELAEAVREDRGPMSQGLVSLTSNVKLLRMPLIMALNLVEPALAFGRVGRILYNRFVDRQARRQTEREAMAREAQGMEQSPGLPTQ